MSVFARLRAIEEKDKSSVVRRLMEYGTPDFDYFYLIGLSVLMATFGLMLNSGAIVIGSMLIAPLMYPILGISLGLVMSNYKVLGRSLSTLVKSLAIGLALSVLGAFFFGEGEVSYVTAEVLSLTVPSLLHLCVAIIAGAAVAYMMTKPEWNDTLPGVAISVALIPPLATVGIGIAALDPFIIKGASVILILNIVGIVATAMVIFLLMNLAQKTRIAEATIKKEDDKQEKEQKTIEKVERELQKESESI